MRSRYLLALTLIAFAALILYLWTNSRVPAVHDLPDANSDFSTVLVQLEGAALTASVGETEVRLGSVREESDGRRILTANLVGSNRTTAYTLQFRRIAGRHWVCCGAIAEETEPTGSKSAYQLGGDAIEIEQLIIWLGWRNRATTVPGPTLGKETAMTEPTNPELSEKDVIRIAIRDFGRERLDQVLEILGMCGKRESPRVHLAILKLADGDFTKLKKITETAILDFRDVVWPAEYPFPHYLRRPDGVIDDPDTERKKNRDQYLEWLTRE